MINAKATVTSELKTKTETTLTRCRHILKTVKNVMLAYFELALTQYRDDLKTIGRIVPMPKESISLVSNV